MRLYTLLFNILAVLLVSACSNKYMNKTENAIQKTDTAHAKEFYNKGIKDEKNGKNADAIDSFDRAISYKADYQEAWDAKIKLLHKMGKYQEAKNAEKHKLEHVVKHNAHKMNPKDHKAEAPKENPKDHKAEDKTPKQAQK